jgi:SAM-dependent methyltransferase
MPMWDQDRTELLERYRQRWQEYGYDSRTLGWNKDCQWVRFGAAFEGIGEDECGSIVDLGCGFGDLLGYLRWRGWKGRYTGVELVPELVEEARRRYANDPAANFVTSDVATFESTSKTDMAVALGVFNHRLHQDNLEFARQAIENMWRLTERIVVCDFLSTSSHPDHRREDLFYADPREIYGLAARYSRRVLIHHAYMPFEFQVKIWHEDSFETAAPVFRPYRHLASAQTNWRETGQTRKGDGN